MHPDSWLILTVAATFFLLGVAGSPLAWMALRHRQSDRERQRDQRVFDLAMEVRDLSDHLERIEALCLVRQDVSPAPVETRRPRPAGPSDPARADRPARAETVATGRSHEQPLIAVPNLAPAPHEREATLQGLTQRYAAIWALADSGASLEVIARATGQPIGQIELILGLRRQIDGANRTTMPHASHK
jgi:hypothetical protein